MSSAPSSPLFVTPGLARQVTLQQRAHFMRFNPTPSEALLWSRLRGRRLGVQFRHGDDYHRHRVAADAQRDSKLRGSGYVVLRLPASLVERRLDEAVALVREALSLPI